MRIDRRTTLLPAALAALCLAAIPAAAQQATGAEGLRAALAEADGGETILLEGGDHGTLELVDGKGGLDLDFDAPVTLRSADPGDPATFTGLDLRGASNIALENLRFDYRFAPGDPHHLRPFVLRDVSDVAIRGSVFDGALARGVSAAEDGHGWAVGLHVQNGRGVTIENNRLSRFMRGMLVQQVEDLTVRGNEVHGIRSDGMNFVQVEGGTISGNYLHGFDRAEETGDHADMIQFWTRGTDRPSRDIEITGNVLMSAHGDATQSIFMRNGVVDRGEAGAEMFYRNVTVAGNVIVNGHLHGITLGETLGATIRNNTLLRAPAFAKGGMKDEGVHVPRINLAEASRDVAILDNLAGGFPEPRPGWRMEGNATVQDRTVMRPGYYAKYFAAPGRGDPANLASYLYTDALDGLAPGRETGAALLRPGADRSAFPPR